MEERMNGIADDDLHELAHRFVKYFEQDFTYAAAELSAQSMYLEESSGTQGRKLLYDLLDEINNYHSNTGKGIEFFVAIMEAIEELSPDLYN